MLLTPFGVDLWNTLLYHLEALQLSFSPFFLCSFPTLSEGYNTAQTGLNAQELNEAIYAFKREAVLLAGLMHPNLPRIYTILAMAGVGTLSWTTSKAKH